jgi:hypothetical protein
MARLIPLAPVCARVALRLMLTCVVAGAATALAACGDDGDSSSKPDTSKLAPIQKLTQSQYTAIEKVYVAGLPLDDLEDITKPAYKRAVDSLIRVCEQLDEDDPLLGKIRATCPVTAELVDASIAAFGCPNPDECGDAFEAAQSSAKDVVQKSRESDAAVNATRLPQSCKTALVTPPEAYAQAVALESAFGKVARAVKTDANEDDAAALQAISAVDDLPEEPSAKQILARLRRNCR